MDLKQIRLCEDHWRELFAEKRSFNEHLDRWYNPKLPDQYTTNAFFPKVAVSREDVAQAYAYQLKQQPGFLQFMCREPMDQAIAEEFQLKENIVLTMAVDAPDFPQWKNNAALIIKDVQSEDIAGEIMEFHIRNEGGESDYPARSIRQDMEAAAEYPEYHWLAAYLNEELVAICHALCFAGCVEIDDLFVAPQARGQYVATSMLRYIAEHFSGTLYLHADEDDTPRFLYKKLGFAVVDRCWEYRRTW